MLVNNQLLHIQILRFFAAAAVVAFHAWGVAPNYIEVPDGGFPFGLSWLLARGGHGVDLFFVISGFIIFYATARAKLTPAEFLRRRVERIVPLYFVVIVIVTLLALTLPATFGEQGWYTPRHILKSLAFISFTDGEMPVVYVGWSLEYEMYFYLATALLMALTKNVWRNIVVAFSVATIAGKIPGVETALGHYAFFVDSLNFEFVLGVIAGYAFVHRRLDFIMIAAAACAIAALLVMDPGNRALLSGIPSAIMVLAAAHISRVRINLSWIERALARLGDASYSIYLAQVQTVSFACKVIAETVPTIAPMALVVAACITVVALGMVLNIFIERPLLALCRQIGARKLSPQPLSSA